MRRPRPLSAAELEARRRKAIEMIGKGCSQAQAARYFSVSEAAVSQWMRRYMDHGPTALLARARRGRPPKLTAEQSRRLLDALSQGAAANGFPDETWTTRRVAELVQRLFDVTMNPDYVGVVLRRYGWRWRARGKKGGRPTWAPAKPRGRRGPPEPMGGALKRSLTSRAGGRA